MEQAVNDREEITPFNIALLPKNKEFISILIDLARNNFSSQSNGYLLGEGAYPHITLCRFESSLTQMKQVWNSLLAVEPKFLSISFNHFYIQAGHNNHRNKYWLGLAVTRQEELINLQTAICHKLSELGINPKHTTSNYFLHLTFARCDNDKIPKISILPSEEFWLNEYVFRLTLGQSAQHGAYKKQLFP